LLLLRWHLCRWRLLLLLLTQRVRCGLLKLTQAHQLCLDLGKLCCCLHLARTAPHRQLLLPSLVPQMLCLSAACSAAACGLAAEGQQGCGCCWSHWQPLQQVRGSWQPWLPDTVIHLGGTELKG